MWVMGLDLFFVVLYEPRVQHCAPFSVLGQCFLSLWAKIRERLFR